MLIRILLLTTLIGHIALSQELSRLMRYSGVIKDAQGAQTLLFSLYRDQDGGAPLWQETLAAELDQQGKFTVILGATSESGLPVDLFVSGEARWLGVKPANGAQAEQRTALLSVPYAMKAKDAETLGGRPLASFLTVENWREASAPKSPAGNSKSNQPGVIRLGSEGVQNTWYGSGAGFSVTSGLFNAFFGNGAGAFTSTGNNNTFIGSGAGVNSNADNNTFVGGGAGNNTQTAGTNSFFGASAGLVNTTGTANSFFGSTAGFTSNGNYNSIFGERAGYWSTTGNNNSYFGQRAGHKNTTGSQNAFLGMQAGFNAAAANSQSGLGYQAGYNSAADNNTFLGAYSDASPTTVSGSTAVGYRALVTQPNSLVLGAVNGVNGASASTKVGIGATAPMFALDVRGPGTAADYLAYSAYNVNLYDKGFIVRSARGPSTAPVATQAGDILFNLYAQGHDGFDYAISGGISMSIDGAVSTGKAPGRMTFLTSDSNGAFTERMRIDSQGRVGIGVTSPSEKLHVAGNILATGNITPSDARLKHNVQPIPAGLQQVLQLNPVVWNWNGTNLPGQGFLAQELEEILPSLVLTGSDAGATKAINYPALIPVLVKAIQEQQQIIERLRAQRP